MEDERYLYALLGVTVACYAGIASIIGVLFYWFNPAAANGCSFNVTVIVLALLVCLVVSAASMHPTVSCATFGDKGFLFASSGQYLLLPSTLLPDCLQLIDKAPIGTVTCKEAAA